MGGEYVGRLVLYGTILMYGSWPLTLTLTLTYISTPRLEICISTICTLQHIGVYVTYTTVLWCTFACLTLPHSKQTLDLAFCTIPHCIIAYMHMQNWWLLYTHVSVVLSINVNAYIIYSHDYIHTTVHAHHYTHRCIHIDHCWSCIAFVADYEEKWTSSCS